MIGPLNILFHLILTATPHGGQTIIPIYRGGNWGPRRLSNLPHWKVLELRLKSRFEWLQKSIAFLSEHTKYGLIFNPSRLHICTFTRVFPVWVLQDHGRPEEKADWGLQSGPALNHRGMSFYLLQGKGSLPSACSCWNEAACQRR